MFTIDTASQYSDSFDYSRLTAREVEALDPFDSVFMAVIQSIPPSFEYTISHMERRPELISYDIYRTTDLWWPLMIYNGIIDHEELRSGVTLLCFKRVDIDKLIAQLISVAVYPVGQHYNRNLTRGRLIPAMVI